jgi:CBS domain containing-hemolysin-like protein
MVPRADIVAVPADAYLDVALIIALEAGHRRLAVYSDDSENIVGVVQLRDLVRVPETRRNLLTVATLADEPLVVPESKRVMDLLGEMQDARIHLAVVVDEYGGTAGLVTVEDIAKELLGSVGEGSDPEPVSLIANFRWSIDAALPIEDLEELIDEPLPEGDWNTVAGMVFALAGRIPEVGDEVRIPGHSLKITAKRQRRITRIELRRL